MTDDYTIGIENELKEKKDELNKIKSTMEEQNKLQQEIRLYVTDLDKLNGEIKQAAGSYEKTSQGKEELAKVASNKKFEEQVKDSLDQIKDQINEVKTRLNKAADDPGGRIKGLKLRQSSLKAELESAKTEVEQAQKQYEELKGKQRVDEVALKSLQDLKAIFDREQQQENKSAAFYTLDKIRNNLRELKLEEPPDFTQELERRGKALAAASKKFRSKIGELETVTTSLEAAQKDHDKYEKDVFAELQKSKLPPQLKPAPQAKQSPPQSRQPAQSAVSVDS